MNERKNRPTVLESGLLSALCALDSQVARALNKTPEERETYGLEKWEIYQAKLEQLTGFLLDCFSEQQVQLDSLLVLSQATAKALSMITEDLGESGLGKTRSRYVLKAAESMERDATQIIRRIKGDPGLM